MTENNNQPIQNEEKVVEKRDRITARKDSKKCIECGGDIDNTYEIFCNQFIRLTRCPHCGKVADKYIEYDNVLVFLDMFLQKPSVYRHLLFNHDQSINSFFIKLFFGSLLLEAYIRQMTIVHPSIYSFLFNIFCIIIEDILFILAFVIPMSIYSKMSISETSGYVIQSYLIGSLGKLFLCLVLMWNNSLSLYLFSITMANLTFIVCMGVVFEIKTWKMLFWGSVVGFLYIIFEILFLPPTPFTNFITNNQLVELLKGELFTFN